LKLTIASADGSIEPPAWDTGDPAVRVQRNLDGSIWAYSYANGTERWMYLPGIASFRFGSRGDEAFVVPDPGTDPISLDAIEDTYQRAVLPMALQAQGDEVLHASAVITEKGVVAFCGRSQTGKSTVAYGLHRRGHRVWADDTLVFDASAEDVQVTPYPHRLRIRAEAADYFDLERLRLLDTSSWTTLEQAQDEPAPLTCLFLLEREAQPSTPVETVRLTPAEALARVVEHAYWFRLDDGVSRRRMIEKYLALATRVPVFRLRFRPTLDQLPAMLDRIQATVLAVATEP
jgi:hypothetical protein